MRLAVAQAKAAQQASDYAIGAVVVLDGTALASSGNTVAEAKGHMTLMGNVNNPDVLLAGTPEQVAAAFLPPLKAGVQILAPRSVPSR